MALAEAELAVAGWEAEASALAEGLLWAVGLSEERLSEELVCPLGEKL